MNLTEEEFRKKFSSEEDGRKELLEGIAALILFSPNMEEKIETLEEEEQAFNEIISNLRKKSEMELLAEARAINLVE